MITAFFYWCITNYGMLLYRSLILGDKLQSVSPMTLLMLVEPIIYVYRQFVPHVIMKHRFSRSLCNLGSDICLLKPLFLMISRRRRTFGTHPLSSPPSCTTFLPILCMYGCLTYHSSARRFGSERRWNIWLVLCFSWCSLERGIIPYNLVLIWCMFWDELFK